MSNIVSVYPEQHTRHGQAMLSARLSPRYLAYCILQGTLLRRQDSRNYSWGHKLLTIILCGLVSWCYVLLVILADQQA